MPRLRKSANCTGADATHVCVWCEGCTCHVAPPPEPDGPAVPPTDEMRAELARVRAGRVQRAKEREAELRQSERAVR